MTKSNSTSSFLCGQLYDRMADDLHLGGMSERTFAGYLRAVRQLTDYCEASPDKITEDGLRRYFLYPPAFVQRLLPSDCSEPVFIDRNLLNNLSGDSQTKILEHICKLFPVD